MNLKIQNISNNTIQLSHYGTVNIDNIPDKDFELIQHILKETKDSKINWKYKTFASLYREIIFKKPFESIYSGRYEKYNIDLNNNHKGKITITITKGFRNKRILKTFIPFIPVTKNNYRIGTYRSTVLRDLYNIVKYQTNVMDAAS